MYKAAKLPVVLVVAVGLKKTVRGIMTHQRERERQRARASRSDGKDIHTEPKDFLGHD